jgi:hypothetical protein
MPPALYAPPELSDVVLKLREDESFADFAVRLKYHDFDLSTDRNHTACFNLLPVDMERIINVLGDDCRPHRCIDIWQIVVPVTILPATNDRHGGLRVLSVEALKAVVVSLLNADVKVEITWDGGGERMTRKDAAILHMFGILNDDNILDLAVELKVLCNVFMHERYSLVYSLTFLRIGLHPFSTRGTRQCLLLAPSAWALLLPARVPPNRCCILAL